MGKKSKTILVVEDEPIISIIVAKALERFGYDVKSANTGEKAVSMALADDPADLVLMDINLGEGIDGTEAARQILAERDLPIVFHTSHSEREMVEKVRGITRYGYVIKSSGDFVLNSSIEMAFDLFNAHEEVRKQSRRSNAILQTIPDMMFIVDSEGKFRDFSINSAVFPPAIPADKIIGSSIGDIFPPGEVSRLLVLFRECLKTGNIQNYSYSMVLNGEHLYFEVITTKLDDEEVLAIVRDITGRKRDEEILREKESMFRSVVEKSHIGVAIINDKSQFIYVNNELCRMSGYEECEIIGKSFTFMLSEDDRELLKERFLRRQRGEDVPTHYEFNVIRKDGVKRTGDIRVAVYTDSSGRTNSLIQVIDITDGKKAEQIIRENNELFSLFMRYSPIYCFIKEVNQGRSLVLQASDNYQDMIGIPGSKMKGKTMDELFDPDFAAKMTADDWSVISEGRVLKLEEELNGRYYDTIKFPIKMGNRTLLAGYTIDITERKKAEIAFRESETRYREILNLAVDGIIILSSDGIILEANRSMCELTGLTNDNIAGIHYAKLPFIDKGADIEFFSLDFLPDKKTESKELILLRPDGSEAVVDVYRRIMSDGIRQIIFHDITRSKLAEENIKKLLTEKNIILREVHHRIKNNMNTISSLLSLQCEKIEDTAAVNALEDAGRRIHSMMLLYDRLYLSTDYRDLKISDYISSLVDEIISNFPNNRNVKIFKKFEDFTLEAKALSNVGIILNELLTNCMKYAFPAGRKGIISVSASRKDDRAVFAVHDNGIGIPENIDFDKTKGFGLDLVSILAEQIGGSVMIVRGEGTMFILELAVH